MKDKVTSVILAGVGGQGALLAARVLSSVAFRSGLDVKSSEVHGMAQRGGSVLAHVRFGRKVYSPLTPPGKADFLIAFEELKALRYRSFLKKNGLIILNHRRILPASVASGQAVYPIAIERTLQNAGYIILPVREEEILDRLPDPRFTNIYCLGILSRQLQFLPKIWEEVIYDSVRPELREANWLAFELGRNTS